MEAFQKFYDLLNPQQKKAVDTLQGPVLVVAGPGTGKTQVLTLRIANILKQTDTNPQNILALTFTDNASSNMRARLSEFIGSMAYQVKISTFHGFGNEIIQNFPEKFAFRSEMMQIDDLTKHRIVLEILTNYNPTDTYAKFEKYIQDTELIEEIMKKKKWQFKSIASPFIHTPRLIEGFSYLKREYILEEDIYNSIITAIDDLNSTEKINSKTSRPCKKWLDAARDIKTNIELLHCFQTYNQQLKANDWYDYEDMICFVNQKLKSDDQLLAHLQERYLYVLVDEYQDTNGSQNEILKQIGNFDTEPNIFVVGDDDQSIYRFQGANVENILKFTTTYPTCTVISLEDNYRSSQEILDLSEHLIKNNKERLVNKIQGLEKELKAKGKYKGQDDKIEFVKYDTGENEYFQITKKIKDLIEGGVCPNEIAVIYRKHEVGHEIVEFLRHEKIPLCFNFNPNIFDEKIIQNLISLIYCIQNPTTDHSLAQVLMFEFLRINKVDSYKIFASFSKEKRRDPQINLFDFVQNKIEENPEQFVQVEDIKVLIDKLLEWRKLEANVSFSHFFITLLEDTQILKKVLQAHDIETLTSLKTLYTYIKVANSNDKEYSLEKFLSDIQAMKDANIKLEKDVAQQKDQSIRLLTAHASKGLEFDYVFIPKFVDKMWGNCRGANKLKILAQTNTQRDDSQLKELKNEDERRLLFVALTRAKQGLFLSHADTYTKDEKKSSKNISQFFYELDSKILNIQEEEKTKEDEMEEIATAILTKKETINLEEQEREYLRSILANFKLSVTALNNYICDPQNFLYSNLLKVPSAKSLSLSLGSAVHKALEHYFKSLQKGESKDLDYLLFILKNALEDELLSPSEFDDVYTKATDIISTWLAYYQDDLRPPLTTEKNFENIYLDDIALSAKVDKIEWIDESKKLVKIIDYKTGSPKTSGVVKKPLDGKQESNLYRQLVFYKLVSQLDSRFVYTVQECELDFLQNKNGKFSKVTFVIPQEDIEELKTIITNTMQKIRNLEF
jgi:DNA helicase II / ATP-dependent DNA helicase PcrA